MQVLCLFKYLGIFPFKLIYQCEVVDLTKLRILFKTKDIENDVQKEEKKYKLITMKFHYFLYYL